MTFESLKIIEPILKALDKAGYTEPTPIQEEAIPPLLDGRDILGCAQTGTGKTASFAVPILQKLYAEKALRKGTAPKALVLTPTRELATQIAASFSAYGEFVGLKNTVIFGGVSQNPQVQALQSGVDILTATPGRLIDLLDQKHVDLRHISYFVLDEADRMLDMGFLRDVERIIARLPEKRQTMLFSATMPAEIEKLTKRILKDPVKVAVTPVSSTVDTIEQKLYYVNKSNKTKLLAHLLKTEDIVSALVFTRTKHGANRLTEALRRAGETCEVIHADKSQSVRQMALSKFKEGKSRVLVATDIVARGIDIVELSHVVNFDLPESPEDYVHRIGRTGRAGHGGTAISFCDLLEIKSLDGIERLTGKRLEVVSEHPYILQDETPEDRQLDAPPRGRRTHHSGNPNGGKSSGSGYRGRYHGNRRNPSDRGPGKNV
ncbi:ATP-dependent RNA helicase RhlE [Sporobacter termitidis DSM 10068]|uniref:ATP-dependent RNA helicase CshA n=1 Tax=Sporobacter termitidis DSM 10068 TaxID=1123282 RepID=A0A1M5TZH4_9FIRM|nr:DEAD/DEAH box helicase [Sporobacter termitidis]SHH55793.1 ATP-dependent RNA helicase RhlE [Sporobacter termitidis DSM 10068]